MPNHALRKSLFFILLVTSNWLIYSQPILSFKEIHDVDSISQAGSSSACFADLYIKTMAQIDEQLKNTDSITFHQIRKLELNFSNYFIQACSAIKDKTEPDKIWRYYFNTPDLSQLQLRLLGINAHINGDLWKALRDSYSGKEIKDIGKVVFLFHQSLLVIYEMVYEDAMKESRSVKLLHNISLGLSKKYGRHLLVKWRKRQIKIATLYYYDKRKFERKLYKVENKKEKIDALIIRRL